MASEDLYQQVVKITHKYLGPPAERFVNRQVINHLKKNPRQLSMSDMNELIVWLRLAMGVLTSKDQLVDDYVRSLQNLTTGSTTK